MISHAPRAWWSETNLYAPRKPRHRLASLGNPKKKKCSLLFDFRGGGFFLKWKGHFSFWVLPSKYSGSVAGLQFGLGFAKLFSGDWIFAKPRLICFLHLSARRRGLGRNPRGLPFGFWRGGQERKIIVVFLFQANQFFRSFFSKKYLPKYNEPRA